MSDPTAKCLLDTCRWSRGGVCRKSPICHGAENLTLMTGGRSLFAPNGKVACERHA
jgi:hypothetical protein